MTRTLLVFSLTLSLAFPVVASANADSIAQLNRHLTTIRDTSRRQRIIGGALGMGLGVAGGIGFFVARNSSDPQTRDDLAPVLGIAGAIVLVAGGLQLAFPTEYETLPEEYFELSDSPANRKVAAGEDSLRQLASRARRERMIGSGTMVAIGVGHAIWYAADSSASSWRLYSAALFTGIGVLGFFVQRLPEDEWDAYQRWQVGRTKSASLSLGLMPAPYSPLGVGATLQF